MIGSDINRFKKTTFWVSIEFVYSNDDLQKICYPITVYEKECLNERDVNSWTDVSRLERVKI